MHGMDALQRALRTTESSVIQDHARDVVSVTTFALTQAVRSGAWRRTGQLASAIGSSVRGLTGYVTIGPEGSHWIWQEFGTVKQGAVPVIRPAAEREAPIFERRIADIAKAIERDFSSYARAA
jgi:HK97 gp10 family phage protein